MKIIIVLVLLYLANFGTSYYLHKKYVAAQKRVRQYGGVSTARTKGGFTKKGKIVLLAFDEEDEIIKYGEKFEDVQNKIRNTITNIEELTKKKEAIQNKLDDASNELYEYEQQIGYHD